MTGNENESIGIYWTVVHVMWLTISCNKYLLNFAIIYIYNCDIFPIIHNRFLNEMTYIACEMY